MWGGPEDCVLGYEVTTELRRGTGCKPVQTRQDKGSWLACGHVL